MLRPILRHATCLLTIVVCGWNTDGLMSVAAAAEKVGLPGKPSVMPSDLFKADKIELEVDGHMCFVLVPAKPTNGDSKPWVWYAPTLLADEEKKWKSPGERHAWIFNRLLAGVKHFQGDLPQILLVIKHLHVGHVILQVLPGLDREQILGITQVGYQLVRHLI